MKISSRVLSLVLVCIPMVLDAESLKPAHDETRSRPSRESNDGKRCEPIMKEYVLQEAYSALENAGLFASVVNSELNSSSPPSKAAFCVSVGQMHQQRLQIQSLWLRLADLYRHGPDDDFRPDVRNALANPRTGINGNINQLLDYCRAKQAWTVSSKFPSSVKQSVSYLAHHYPLIAEDVLKAVSPGELK